MKTNSNTKSVPNDENNENKIQEKPIIFSKTENKKIKNKDKLEQKVRTRCPFSKEEDKLLLELVNLFGIENKNNWHIIAFHMNGRSVRQCRERYQLFLSEEVRKKEKWTKEEDEILLSKYQILGPHWKKMEEFFNGRTSYNIKNRFISLNRKKRKEDKKKSCESTRCEEDEYFQTKSTPSNSEYRNYNFDDFQMKIDFDQYELTNFADSYAIFY